MSTEETIKALAEEYYKKLTEKTPMKGIGSHEHIYFTYGVEWAFEKLREGTERVECYLPVPVERGLPDESTFYNCIVEPTKNNLNDTANRFFDKGTNYFLVGNSDDYRQVTHWLKKTVLTVVRESDYEPSKEQSQASVASKINEKE